MAHPKGLLIERAQKLGLERPEFDTAKTGPEHEPVFITDVVLDGEVIGTGQGRSKRESEKAAAEEALAELTARESGTPNTKASGRSAGKSASRSAGKTAAKASAAGRASGRADAEASDANGASADVDDTDYHHEDDDGTFTGPWPMFDDLLASVVDVAERRVSADLRGDAALKAIRDFSLTLYKELLADLGEVVDEDEDDDEEDD
mgnify:CR=1 FL=1